MRLTIFLSTFILIIINLVSINIVKACSGPGPTLHGAIESSEIIVYATVVDTDSQSANSILQVHQYFKGEGDEYILLAGNTFGLTNGLNEFRFLGGTCAGYNPSLRIGEPLYFFLRESLPGTYRLSGGGRYSRLYFPETDTTYTIDLDHETQDVTLTEQDLLIYLDADTENPTLPNPNVRPIPSYLRITTKSGQDYVLPPDRSEPILLNPDLYIDIHNSYLHFPSPEVMATCATNLDCYKLSPGAIDLAYQLDEDTFFINRTEYAGYYFLFSSTGEAIAIWDDNRIDIRPMRHLSRSHRGLQWRECSN